MTIVRLSGVPERVLTPRELNRAVLARQLLLERAALRPAAALERVAGLQTQYAPTGYVGLWSRTAGPCAGGMARETLTDALTGRDVVQAWVMRATIHMVSARDYRPFTEAVRVPRSRLWVPPDGVDMAAVVASVRDRLADGPRTQAQIQARLVEDGHPRGAWRGVQLHLDLVRVPPAGTWEKPRAHVYGLVEDWLRPGDAPSEEAGQELLVRRYLGGFGPASVRDVALFCGWTPTAARAVLARLELRRFHDESGGELLDLPRAPRPPADTPAPVRFLGPWDAVLLVHCRRAQTLPEEFRPRVFATSMPQSVPTFLVDGQVAGTWRHEDGAVTWTAFDELRADAARDVDAEAARLAELYR